MFYVYHGYVSPDNYDNSERPIYEITEFITREQVLEFKKEFDDGIHDECGNVIFRVFEGKERRLIEKQVVTEFDFE